MSKLYVFGIGGTGARVIRSFTMLLASGVELGSFDTIVPILIDPDKGNGDLTRTVTTLQEYNKIHNKLHFNDAESTLFKVSLDDLGTNYRLPVANVGNMSFGDYIKYINLDNKNRALISLLFSKKNLASSMDVGFKGNPNMGSVVLNDFRNSSALNNLMSNISAGDKIFIISSIFGGTGAAGFPLLLKTFREADQLDLPNSATIKNAPIGAITVLPYFGVRPDSNSEIDMETFITKAKSALTYYKDNMDVDALYYICDNLKSLYDNQEGDKEQQNMAHFVEFASALAIVDFARSNIDRNADENGKVFKEFAIVNDADSVNLKDLCDSTRNIVAKPLITLYLFAQFFQMHLRSTWDNAWAKEKKFDDSLLTQEFYVDLDKFLRSFMQNWLHELASNKRSFAPFNLVSGQSHPFHSINGFEPKKSTFFGKMFGNNLDDFPAIDSEMGKVSAELKNKLSGEDYFVNVLKQAIEHVVKNKFNI